MKVTNLLTSDGKITYPLYLVPQKDFKIITDINPSDYLASWVHANVELKDSDGKLNPSAVDISRLPDFSTNKLPPTIVSDVKINFTCEKAVKDEYIRNWAEGVDGIVPKNDHWETVEGRQIYFFKINDINGFSGNYLNPPDKEDKKFIFSVSIVHKPTMTNYWHFEFYIYNDRNERIKELSNKGWRKLVSSAIVDKMQEISVFDIN